MGGGWEEEGGKMGRKSNNMLTTDCKVSVLGGIESAKVTRLAHRENGNINRGFF